MKISGDTIFICLVTLNINRYVFGWNVQTHSCSSSQGLGFYNLNDHTPAVKLFFMNIHLVLQATGHGGDIFGRNKRCTSRIVSENGTSIGIRMLGPYQGAPSLYTESRWITIRDDNGLDRSFTSNQSPKEDIMSSTNGVNVTINDNIFARSISVLVYQFRRGTCRSNDYKCQNDGICLNYKLFTNDMYDFCNTEGLTTTYRPQVDTGNGYSYSSHSSSSSSSGYVTVFLVILFVIVIIAGGGCCFCYCCKAEANNVQSHDSDENVSSANAVVNTISDHQMIPTTPTYAGIDVSVVWPPTSSTSSNVNAAPPDYDTLKFDSLEIPPSYEEVISKTNDN